MMNRLTTTYWTRRRSLPVSTHREPVTVFVFSGGALNGAAQAGMVRELLAAGVYPDAVVGVSAGAWNAIYVATTPFDQAGDELVKIWMGIGTEGIFEAGPSRRLWAILRKHPSLDPGTKVEKILEANCKVADLADARVPIRVGTLNLETATMEWHSNGPAKPRLRASAAIPGVFPPVLINGARHVDGGATSPVPLGAANYFSPTRIIVLDVSLMDLPTGPPQRTNSSGVPSHSAMSVLLASFDAARYHIAQAEKAAVGADVEVITIRAGIPGATHASNTHHVPRIIEMGAQAAREALAAHPHIVPTHAPRQLVSPGQSLQPNPELK
jgi:predicted acylesterase/phospholipase RssA